MKYIITIAISIFYLIGIQGQNSFIVQLKNGASLVSKNDQFDRSANKNTIKQICDAPMNLWLISGERVTINSIEKEYADKSNIIFIKENLKIKSRLNPNDSLYSKQWQYLNTGVNSGGKVGADINAEAAWNITTGGKTINGDEIVVAVVDGGFDIDHEDIFANLWVNKLEIPGDKLDNDKNGYIDDINGWNVGSSNGNLTTNASHGTPVAGIVGAKGNNKIGVTGVNWDVKLMMIKYGNADEAGAIASYSYAYKMRKLYNSTNGKEGAFVVATNSSWGVDRAKPETAPFWCAFYDSLGTVGILSMGATTNNNFNVDEVGDLPTGCDSEFLISVTNFSRNDVKVNSAGYGLRSVDIGAYGEGTFTVAQNDEYAPFGGTSGATPHVSGAVALMYSVQCDKFGSIVKSDPAKAALMVKDLILSNTTPKNSIATTTTSGGGLNLGKSINAMVKQCESCIAPSAFEMKSNTNSLMVSWLGNATSIDLRVKKEDGTQWDTYNLSGNSFELKGLDFCTPYVFQIRYTCNNVTSDWGYRKNISTTGCCPIAEVGSYKYIDNKIKVLTNGDTTKSFFEIKLAEDTVWDTFYYTSDFETQQLKECAQYQIRFSTFCDIQQKYSPSSNIEIVNSNCGNCTKPDYCEARGLDNDLEWIESIVIGDKTFNSGLDANGYGNQIGAFIPQAIQGDTVTFGIIPGFKGNRFSENYTAYIDWDQNFIFDENEKIFETLKPTTKDIDTFLVVPKDATIGLTRMRIIMSFKDKSPACDYTTQYGEVEDYCFIVDKSVGLDDHITSDISIFPNPSNGQFTLTWDKKSKIDYYEIYNALGQLVGKDKVNQSQGALNIEIDVPGYYQIVIQTNRGQITKGFAIK
jgi:serine protease